MYFFYGTDTATPFGPAQANQSFRFVIRFTVPSGTEPQQVRFSAQGRMASADVPFTVTASSLPRTGGHEVLPLLGVLLLIGSAHIVQRQARD